MVLFDINPARFDPLGRAQTPLAYLVTALPQELSIRLKDARFGIMNMGDDAPEESAEDKVRAEVERQLHTGEVIAVSKETGEVLAPRMLNIVVANQGSLYGILLEFGGYEACFVAATGIKTFDQLANWLPGKEDITQICLIVR